MILLDIKKSAEFYLERTVWNAVVTLPSLFGHFQRQAIRDAGTTSGLNIIGTTDEATAAAIAYGLDREISEERNIIVFDLGGCMLNVSLVAIEDGIFEVKAVAGDMHLGGEDFNNRLVNHFIHEFKQKYKEGDFYLEHFA
jgi:L1 cell adhesion molecule like protein